jgi:membrane associated rhomboid family serine protease
LPIPIKDNVPLSRVPLVTILLIVACVATFAWQLTFSGDGYSSPAARELGLDEREQSHIEYGAIPYRLLHPGRDCAAGVSGGESDVVCEGTAEYGEAQSGGLPFVDLDEAVWPLTVLTSMFMHADVLHLGINMLFLWIFGANVEMAMGRLRFTGFYLLAGAAAVYVFSIFDSGSTTPLIGASGAIAGVMGAYAVLLPRARVMTLLFLLFFFTLLEIPAFVLMGLWLGLQVIPFTRDLLFGADVAILAHVAGFLFGLAAVRAFARRQPQPASGPADRPLPGT